MATDPIRYIHTIYIYMLVLLGHKGAGASIVNALTSPFTKAQKVCLELFIQRLGDLHSPRPLF